MLGQSPEIVVVDLMNGAQKDPAYLAINPNGKVPTLVDGETVIWESIAIMMYLADNTDGQTLYPKELRARADVNKWLLWTACHWSAAIAQLNFENFLKRLFGQGEPNEYAVKRAEAMINEFATTLDSTLGRSRHVVGDRMTLADLAIAAPLMYTQNAKLPISGFANMQRWFGEIQKLDAWKATEPSR